MQAVQGHARDKAEHEGGDARDARHHGCHHACLGGHEELSGAECVGAVGVEERAHHRHRHGAADQGADRLADPHCARVGADDLAGFEVTHDVAREAACHGYHACDEKEPDLIGLSQGGDDQQDDEAGLLVRRLIGARVGIRRRRKRA